MKRIFSTLLLMSLSLAASAQTFTSYTAFPPPAPSPFGGEKGFTGVALPGGRLVIWNGAELYLQDFPQSDGFRHLASNIEGDPGFLVLTPDEQTLVMGEGYGGRIYTLPVADLATNHAPTTAATFSHYSGIALTDDLLLLDVGKSDFSGTELQTLSLSGAKSVPRVVLRAPAAPVQKDLVLDKPLASYSSSLHIDRGRDLVFVMDGNARELRSFSAAALLAAHNSGTPLDWEADGTLIGAAGMFFTGGVEGMTSDGLLIVDGSAGFLQPGGIQIVDPSFGDPAAAYVITTYDPAGTAGFYNAIVNEETGGIVALTEDGRAWGTDIESADVPVASAAALALLAGILAALGAVYGVRRRGGIH